MRKVVCILMCAFICAGCFSSAAFAEGESIYVRKREDIFVRDPCILFADGKYYMYGTGLASGRGYGCCYSEDLENWTISQNVFTAPADFDGVNNFWAPECYYYNGSYWLFATYFSSKYNHRGVSVFKSESPLGPFEEIGGGNITPHNWDAIDGTLYVDEDGQPWMVFIYEWTCTDNEIGGIAAAKLSDDFSELISEPIILFYADDAKWTIGGVTDGPFLYKTSADNLIMLWSSGNCSGYCVGIAHSSNGKIDGEWSHEKVPLYRRSHRHNYDGGHAMLFTDLNGQLTMSLHSPNSSNAGRHETAEFIPVKDIGTTLILADSKHPELMRIIDRIFYWFEKLADDISNLF